MRHDLLYHRLSLLAAGIGAAYLLVALLLFLAFAPFRAEILGLSVSLTSLAKPARVALALLLLACLFRYLSERKAEPGLTPDQFLSRGARQLSGQRLLALLPALALAGAVVYFTGYKIRQQASFHTNGYDLAVCDRAFFNTFHGAFLQAWGLKRNYFSQHFSPILLFLLPLYRLWPSPFLLLSVQGLAAGGALLAAFLLGRRLGLPPWPAILAGGLFVLHPSYQAGFRLDFHQEMLFPPLLFLAVYFLLGRRMAAFYLVSVLALTVREDVSLYLAAFSVYVALGHSRRWGLLLLGTSLAWAAAAFWIAIPLSHPAGPGAPSLIGERYGHYGATYGAMAKNIAADGPALFRRSLAAAFPRLLKPLFYLPVLSPAWLLLGLLPVALNVCSSSELQRTLAVYYGVAGLAFFAVGFLAVLARIWRGRPLFKFAAAVGLSYLLLGMKVPPWDAVLPSDRLLGNQLETWDWSGKKICAGTALIPHLPRENAVSMFPQVDGADLVLLYMRPGQDYSWPLDPGRFREEIAALLEGGRYRVAYCGSRILFLEKGEGEPETSRKILRMLREWR